MKPKKSEEMKVKIVNKSGFNLPEYATSGAAGVDLRACVDENVIIKPLGRKLIKTGLFVELPKGYEAQIRTRSGMALKWGVSVLNSPGTIDCDYRGEIGVILANFSDCPVEIEPGDRVAQMVFSKVEKAVFVEVDELTTTDRGKGGFGSTGVKMSKE